MEDIIIFDNEDTGELARLTAEWNPEKWISAGKVYHDVPPEVQAAEFKLLEIPRAHFHKLPPPTLSITELLHFHLPLVAKEPDNPMHDEYEHFSDEEPSVDVDGVLVPTRRELNTFRTQFGQAWFDGKKSLRWNGSVLGFASVPVTSLASFFSTRYLGSNLVDALLDVLAIRLRDAGLSDGAVVANSTFAQFVSLYSPMKDGTVPLLSHPGAQKYLTKYAAWFRTGSRTSLFFVLYRPPSHWTTCSIDFEARHIRYGDGLRWPRPAEFFDALGAWLIENFPDVPFTVSDDLPCAIQTDGYSCPIISVNAVAHTTMGDALWTAETADAMRMRAFCDILQYSGAGPVVHSSGSPSVPKSHDLAENLLALHPDVNDSLLVAAATFEESSSIPRPAQSEPVPPTSPVASKKRAADCGGEDERKSKVAKTESSSDQRPVIHPFFGKSFKPPPPPPPASKLKAKSKSTQRKPADFESSGAIGISKSANAARKLREAVKAGTFVPSAKRTANFRAKCLEVDPNAEFEETCSQVRCSNCKEWKIMQEPYGATRFKQHVEAQNCSPPPPDPVPDPSLRTLNDFKMVVTCPKPTKLPPPAKIQRPCPGLTRSFDELVGRYLDNCVSSGGGGRSDNHYSSQIFDKKFTDLTNDQKDTVETARFHDRAWRNDTSPRIMACFATGTNPCLRTVAGMLFARFKGLEALLSEDDNFSVERRFFQYVVDGKFKDDKVFTGIVKAKVLATDREVRGKGLQNFKYDTDLDGLMGLIHSMCPRAYRELQKHFPLRTERSIKHIVSNAPRFPLGIVDQTFIHAKQYLEHYNYPMGAPLSLAVDDTKLFAALRPLFDGVKKCWYIVGSTGEPIAVPDAAALHATIDELQSTAELATKLRLWVLQIPLPGVPPLVLAIMPLGSKVKGAQLADSQIRLMEGLVSRGFRITSSGGDGASVERDCQRRTASACKLVEYRIKHPDGDYPDIIVQIWDLDGNLWVVIQDAKHGRKTFKNNLYSGAHTLVLGNYPVFYQLVHKLGIKQGSPLYHRDFIKSDRMDDRAAARVFSADFLEQAAQDPSTNLGLFVYLLVFGDFIDAWQSRTLSHHERARIVIRTHLFLQTWREFLGKAGYSEARYFISKESFDIAQILINGLLGLIIIHRDHLGDNPCPLLPWFNASEPNEHSFSGLRDIFPDFTLQQAIIGVPKLRAKMEASVRIPKTHSDFKKQASGYCHTYYSGGSEIDFERLNQYPTDAALAAAYQIAGQENECLWSLLGIHPFRIKKAPIRQSPAAPLPNPSLHHLYMQEESNSNSEDEKTPAEELQELIDNIQTMGSFPKAVDDQLDACIMASVALSMDELARVENMAENDPARFAEIQSDIAKALATQPAAVFAVLQNIADSATRSAPQIIDAPPVLDISSDDLSSLIVLRREHQTEEARKGVRTYKTSDTYVDHRTGAEKPLTDRQKLARQMQSIILQGQERGSSTGLNRKVRWTEQKDKDSTPASESVPKTGNAANAELAASGRSKDRC
ncbi:hypothetical protein R3P38DRAFT_2570976 [Favolaschia claudopus]|uniref:Ubiquitin-like protease family profile domain-containing protein n=1 Tax=Favolaschia claudopus TaxID=2862362 RepID=A0AAV9ZTS6_9AGAR